MLSTVAIAAALAIAPAAQARKFGSFADRFGKGPGPTSGGFNTSGPKVIVSSAKCEAVAVAKNFSASKDAHVFAVAEAWKYACSLDAKFDDWYWAHIYKNMIDVYGEKEFGFAFAKAVAATAAQCDTSGNAYGCAASYAYSAAWADASASAHASAWAEAVQTCNCNNKEQITAANSDTYASESAYFKVDVEAVAESSACGYKGYDDAPDADAQTCVQNIYFTSIAKAVATAAIDGECLSKNVWNYDGETTEKDYGTFVAAAKTKATAKITVNEVYGCVDYISNYNPYH